LDLTGATTEPSDRTPHTTHQWIHFKASSGASGRRGSGAYPDSFGRNAATPSLRPATLGQASPLRSAGAPSRARGNA